MQGVTSAPPPGKEKPLETQPFYHLAHVPSGPALQAIPWNRTTRVLKLQPSLNVLRALLQKETLTEFEVNQVLEGAGLVLSFAKYYIVKDITGLEPWAAVEALATTFCSDWRFIAWDGPHKGWPPFRVIPIPAQG